jgi:hypothetical protein
VNWVMALSALFVLAVLVAAVLVWLEIRRKNIHLWLRSYLSQSRPVTGSGPVHLMFTFVDHFEPGWRRPSYEVEVERVSRWRERYPQLVANHQDADGVRPQHTFFYPEEEYRPEHLDRIAELCGLGLGEIEVHLHHDNDTAEGLSRKLEAFVRVLHDRHGALPIDPKTGRTVFGFIHGNWALDNSRDDGRMCGVNNELHVLAQNGCYADFTLPSAPSSAQTRAINRIYYATDDHDKAKSHDDGVDVSVGASASGDLMIVQGPLSLNWRDRKWGLFPRIEAGDIRRKVPPTTDRIDLWIRQHIHVRGRPEWIFVKVHTHGTQEADMDCLLGAPVDDMFSYLERRYNDGVNYVLHYVTARESFNIIKAAEAGMTGDPGQFRDFALPRPANVHRPEPRSKVRQP